MICNGYVVSKKGSQQQVIVGGHKSLLSNTWLTISPGSRVFASEQDYQSFNAFETGMVRQLKAAMPSDLWDKSALQLCQNNVAVNKAVLGLGVLSRGLQTHLTAAALHGNGEEVVRIRQLALRYYGQSVKALRLDLDSGPASAEKIVQVALCCLLLGTFELLVGRVGDLQVHTRAALHAMQLVGRDMGDVAGNATLAAMLCQMSRFHSIFAMVRSHILGGLLPVYPGQDTDSNILYEAPGFTLSSKNLFDLSDEVTLVYRAFLNIRYAAVPIVAGAGHENHTMETLTCRLDTIEAQASAVLHRTKADLDEVMHEVLKVNMWILRLQIESFGLHLNSLLSEANYSAVLDPAEDLLKKKPELLDRVIFERTRYNMKACVHGMQPLFSFVAVLIQPLHFVASHSCYYATQKRAVDLLSIRQWREGGWDSTVISDIAKRRMTDMFVS